MIYRSYYILPFIIPWVLFTEPTTRITVGDNPEKTIYYLSPPQTPTTSYPIIVLCEGSYCAGEAIESVLRLHTMFAPLLAQTPAALLSIEKHGVDGSTIDTQKFHMHNTRSRRIQDHEKVLQALIDNPPSGWNGTWIFIGGSEGGDVISALTLAHAKKTIATVNFAGIGAWSCQDEIWEFIQHIRHHGSLLQKSYAWWFLPHTRQKFDDQCTLMLKNPTHTTWWLGQTYAYWADAFTRTIDIQELCSLNIPMLVVVGSNDPLVLSCNDFINLAHSHHAPITYWHIEEMGHGIAASRPDLFPQAIEWLNRQCFGLDNR